ncbi:MAG: biotin transporter BioY [Candidatus Omnitrophica bacterium]|nr:biotin transporter BioY [Candidatus Omnitrophota bacterium]MDD5574192.1 biotin transporter BioY [Candidatus Omnitrophota bacterium]
MTILTAALSKERTLLTGALKIGAMTTLLCFSSFVKVPLFFTPVPVTMQTFVVFLAAGILGPAQAFVSVAAYIAIGVWGAPFFANAGWGVPYLLGPTGGYLLGFLAAAWMTSKLRGALALKTAAGSFACMALGMVVIHVCGVLWLMAGLRMTALQALSLGSLPFILPDLMKAWAASWICVRARKN